MKRSTHPEVQKPKGHKIKSAAIGAGLGLAATLGAIGGIELSSNTAPQEEVAEKPPVEIERASLEYLEALQEAHPFAPGTELGTWSDYRNLPTQITVFTYNNESRRLVHEQTYDGYGLLLPNETSESDASFTYGTPHEKGSSMRIMNFAKQPRSETEQLVVTLRTRDGELVSGITSEFSNVGGEFVDGNIDFAQQIVDAYTDGYTPSD